MCSAIAFAMAVCACSHREQRFSRMPESQTGIAFNNEIKESDSLNIFTFEYLYNGGGVGVGDFNNDGLQDLYFTGNAVSSRLYLNKGDFHFTDVTATSGTSTNYWCTGVAVIDINQDGWKDIYVSTAYSKKTTVSHNQLFLNRGPSSDGIPRFEEVSEKTGLNTSGYHTQAAFLDYDADGDLDVYLCINSFQEPDRNQLKGQRSDGTGESQDRLFRNEGMDSTGLPFYRDVSKESGIQTEGWGLGVIVKDFNRDGWPDIYVANDFQSNDHLYINQRNGKFTNEIEKYLAHQSHNAMGVDMADINNDGLEDLCVVDMLPDDNLRQKTMFGSVPNDRYQTALKMGYQPQFVRNTLQLNNGLLPEKSGAPAFSEIGNLAGIAATDWSWTPLFADFDLDGWKDLLITNGYVKDITDQDFAAFSSEYLMFGKPEQKMAALREKAKSIGEVKKPDFLFMNNKDCTFTNRAIDDGLSEPTFSNGAVYADLDNDGDPDIVINNLNGLAHVYRNNSIGPGKKEDSLHALSVELRGLKGNLEGIGAKVSVWCEGRRQFAEHALQRGYLSSVDPRLFFGLANSRYADSVMIEWPSGRRQELVHVSADRPLILKENDAVQADSSRTSGLPKPLFTNITDAMGLHYVHQENDYQDFLYQFTLPHKLSIQGPSLSVADINNDGLDDFYAGGSSRHSGYFFIQSIKGFEQRALTNDSSSKRQEETGTLLFDADNDGDPDLYCVGGGNEFGDSSAYTDMFLLNDGKGNFTRTENALPNTSAAGSCVIAVDFDRDGDLDLFVGGYSVPQKYPLPARSYLLRNDRDAVNGVRFTDVTEAYCPALMAPGMVTSGLWTDVDNDKYPDLMIAGEFMPLQFYRNLGGKSFALQDVAAFRFTQGWYNTLAEGDFDNDGDMDYVAGNLGLNSRYKASRNEAVTVRCNDFNLDGTIDAFLFSFTDHREYPAHTRSTVLDQIPALRKRIYRFHDYGTMGYNEIFTETERRNVKEWPAYEMASLYIENKGKGEFSISRLPMVAQFSPVFGIIPIDINGDEFLDIIGAGNSYAPEALTGRYDASVGWALKGDGHGHFKSIPPAESGFVVSGDAKSLVKLQVNGSPAVIASTNSGPLKCFSLCNSLSCRP